MDWTPKTTQYGWRGLAAAAVLLLVGAGNGALASDEALVIDGETIADAELFSAAKEEGFLLSYTTNFEALERQVLEQFKADTGIDFDMVRLTSGRMYERVLSEKAAGELNADLISSTDLKMAEELAQKGIFAPHTVPNDESIPDVCKDDDRHWYFENRFPAVLVYNTAVLDVDPPTGWEDLAKPEYENKFGLVRAATGGSSWNVALFHRRQFGKEFWGKLAANSPLIYTSQAPLMEDVARGEAPIGVATIGLFAQQLIAGAPVGIIFPKEGIPTVPNILGVSATANNPNAARLFMNWVLAKRGASVIQDITMDYSCNTDVGSPSLPEHDLTAPDSSQLWTASRDDWVNLRDDWVVEWDEVFGTGQ